ncbi:MAG: monomethylamine:corrinoid methyltransferase [Anaerolineales bacterium]|nr:monomethylamine:corrinoid methyltransferase [Anaerolineales bacterium]
MRNATRLVDILDRMEHGPIMVENDYDMKVIVANVPKLTKKYEIKFDGENLVNTDDAMADRLFEAGLELAALAGVYCQSNSRRMLWSKEEILDTIKWAPTEVKIGSGHDEHVEYRRDVEDPRPPTIVSGPIGTTMQEELVIPIMQSYIQEPITDTVIAGTLDSVYGREIRTKSPWEIMAGWHEVELTMIAAKRAGRESISIGCVESANSDLPELSVSSYGGYRPTDWHHIAMISELKTDYQLLNKLTHLAKTDSIIHSFCNPIYGGLAGGAEGLAVVTVAGLIMLQMAYMTTTHSQCPTHPFFLSDTAPEIIWSIGMSVQAMSRNTPFMLDVLTSPVGGPGTKTLLYECAAVATTSTVSGAARLIGVRSAVGKISGHVSGLEARFNGEIGHAAAGMSREQANEIVKKAVASYKDQLDKEPYGKNFPEVYDLHTLKPKDEWQKMYDEVKEEMFKLGLPFK